jgi:acetyl-CoA carboxylase biotin carboxyl carrier protein
MPDKTGFIPPDDEEIIEILDVVNESDFDELRLEMAGLKLVFSKSAVDLSEHPSERTLLRAESPAPGEKTQQAKADMTTAHKTDLPEPAEAPPAEPVEEEGLVPVTSPLLGIFYRAPKPGAPPFVELGSYVTEDDSVCLIEVMKCFNTVKADVKGRVVKILAENNQMVEYKQTLFLIDPEAGPEESSGA